LPKACFLPEKSQSYKAESHNCRDNRQEKKRGLACEKAFLSGKLTLDREHGATMHNNPEGRLQTVEFAVKRPLGEGE
jgi:hypothetical protein